MKLPFARDLPRGAASVAVALTLIAGVVAGRDEPSTSASPIERAPEPAPAATASAAQAALPDLDVDKLIRAVRSGEIADLFAMKTMVVPPPPQVLAPVVASPPPPPPIPTAPPLPFRYFGKWIDGDKTVVFLWRDNEGYSAAAGDTVAGTYRIESISEASVDFVYLPLGTKQTLPITQAN